MTFAEWDEEIQAFPPNRPDQAFTECVRLGRSNRRLQNTNAETLQCRVQARGEDSIAVVDDVAVRMIEHQKFPELPRDEKNNPMNVRNSVFYKDLQALKLAPTRSDRIFAEDRDTFGAAQEHAAIQVL